MRSFYWDWIYGTLSHAGPEANLPPIYMFSTAANIFSYILSGIGYAAKEILDLNGFLILFDEAENIDPYLYSSYQNKKGWNFLKGLILMTENSDDLFNDQPFRQIPIKHKQSKEIRGQRTYLLYHRMHSLPYIWKKPSSVKIIFAFTPSEILKSNAPLNRLDQFNLNPLDHNALQKIATQIANIYFYAYNYKTDKARSGIPKNLLKNKDTTREYIKSLVEIFDLLRFHPKKQLYELLE